MLSSVGARSSHPNRMQDAENVCQRKKTVIWFIWFVSFVWLNQTNQIDQMNQRDQQTGLVPLD